MNYFEELDELVSLWLLYREISPEWLNLNEHHLFEWFDNTLSWKFILGEDFEELNAIMLEIHRDFKLNEVLS
jgi:hypothetical protein